MKKFLKVSAGLFLSFFFLLALIILLLPYLVNLEAIKSRVEKEAAQKLKAEVKVSELRLTLLPRPGLKLKGLQIEAPSYHLGIEAAALGFRLRPLLDKRFEIEGLNLERPKLKIFLSPQGKPTPPFRERLRKFLNRVPLVKLNLQHGELTLLRQGEELFQARDLELEAEIRRDQILLEAQSKSKAWDSLLLSLKFWPDTGFLEGSTEIRRLNLYCFPFLSPYLPTHLKTDLSLALTFRREDQSWHLGFKGTAPCVAKDEDRNLLFSCSAFLGEALLRPKEKRIKIKQLIMKVPEIIASGEYLQTEKGTSLKIDLEKGDFTGWRERFLPLASKNKGLNTFFKVLRKAHVEKAQIIASGPTPKEAFKFENIRLQAQVTLAEVHLPIFPKPLKVKEGLCQLKRRTLYVEKASGTYQHNLFKNGRLEIYLFNRERPFLFEADLEAEAPEALTIVKRLVKKRRIQEELAKIKDIKGKASGHLRIEGSLRHPVVSFTIKPQEVSLVYQRLPFPLILHQGTISYARRRVDCSSLDLSLPKTHLQSLSGSLSFAQKPVFLNLKEARGRIWVSELNAFLGLNARLRSFLAKNRLKGGELHLIRALYKGPFIWSKFQRDLVFEAQAKDVSVVNLRLPGELKIKKGFLRYEKEHLTFGPLESSLLDASGLISGEISPLFGDNPSIFLKGRLQTGPHFMDWIFEKGKIPKSFYPVLPLEATQFEFSLTPKALKLSGTFITAKKATIKLALEEKKDLLVSKLKILIEGKTTDLGFSSEPEKIAFYFRGRLEKGDLEKILAKPWPKLKLIQAQIKGKYYPRSLIRTELKGPLHLRGLRWPWKEASLLIEKLDLKGQGNKIIVQELAGAIDDSSFQASGEAEFTPKNIHLTGAIYIPEIKLEKILKKRLFTAKRASRFPPVVFELDWSTDKLFIRRFTFQEVTGTLFYHEKRLKWVIEKANLCGIRVSGEIDYAPSLKSLQVSYSRSKGDFDQLMTCLFERPRLFRGSYSLEGSFKGQGEKGPFLENTTGRVLFVSSKGEVYKFGLLAKLFAFLNPIELFKGKLPDLSTEGFAYELLEIKGHFEKHYLIIDESRLEGTGLRIFASGKLDLRDQKIYLTALVSPFVAVDTLVSHIPIIGWVLTGKSKTFFSIPVEIRGSMENPEIIPLDPRAVSKRLLGIIERTFKLPVKIFFPGEKNPPPNPKGPTTPKNAPDDK